MHHNVSLLFLLCFQIIAQHELLLTSLMQEPRSVTVSVTVSVMQTINFRYSALTSHSCSQNYFPPQLQSCLPVLQSCLPISVFCSWTAAKICKQFEKLPPIHLLLYGLFTFVTKIFKKSPSPNKSKSSKLFRKALSHIQM